MQASETTSAMQRTNGHSAPSEHAELVRLLQELLDVSRTMAMAINDLALKDASTAEARSSVEVKTSTRGVDVTAKAYAGSPIQEAGTAAYIEYFRVLDVIETEMAIRRKAQAA
jgi:hypothetical protein